jgi:hypothetical protein
VQLADVEFNVANVHEPELLKLPPAAPSLQVTVPLGVAGDNEVFVTVAVYVIVFPIVTAEGAGFTMVAVVDNE